MSSRKLRRPSPEPFTPLRGLNIVNSGNHKQLVNSGDAHLASLKTDVVRHWPQFKLLEAV
jgi:hypothetical protein